MKRPETKHRSLLPLVIALFALSFAAGCGGEFTELETPETCTQELQLCEVEVFLSVQEFEFLRQNGAHILDVRNQEAFSLGHIPGSYWADWQSFADTENRNGIIWEDEAILEEAARSFGINNEDVVIVVGAGDGRGGDARAGRLFWTLEYIGHERVYLVDGGFAAWEEARYDGLQAGFPEPEAGNFEVNLRPDRRATIEEVEEAIEDGTIRLVDTRTVEEWMGLEEARRENPRGGYIPEAIHYHWENVMEDGKLRPRDEILAELEALGIVPGTLTIPYCQSGVRSGYFYAVLKWLGFPEPKNYDGSWWEWSRADDLEIALPEEE